jgi:hypothetical protein
MLPVTSHGTLPATWPETSNSRPCQGRVLCSYVSRRLTSKTGVTVRNLRRVRYLFVLIREGLPLPQWPEPELELVWRLLTEHGGIRGPWHRTERAASPYMKRTADVKATRSGRGSAGVGASLAARPYLGARGCGAGGLVGASAAAHSSQGSAVRAGRWQERAADLSVRWGLGVSHESGHGRRRLRRPVAPRARAAGGRRGGRSCARR